MELYESISTLSFTYQHLLILFMKLSICKTWGTRTEKDIYLPLQNVKHCDEDC